MRVKYNCYSNSKKTPKMSNNLNFNSYQSPFFLNIIALTLLSLGFATKIELNKSTKKDASCNSSWVLDEIKEYLERDDFSKAITRSSPGLRSWMNPQIFWDRVGIIENICNSTEAKLLRYYCHNWENVSKKVLNDLVYMKGRTYELGFPSYNPYPFLDTWNWFAIVLKDYPLPSGRIPLHYCTRVSGLSVKEVQVLDYGTVETILYKLLDPCFRNNIKINHKINFGPEIQKRIKEGKDWKKYFGVKYCNENYFVEKLPGSKAQCQTTPT